MSFGRVVCGSLLIIPNLSDAVSSAIRELGSSSILKRTTGWSQGTTHCLTCASRSPGRIDI